MLRCQNCGQVNSGGSNFCRFCGVNFTSPQTPVAPQNNRVGYEYSPPKPYSWKTDELNFKEEKQTKPINRVRPLVNKPPQPTQKDMTMPHHQYQNQQMVNHQPQSMVYGYRCPRCSSQQLPVTQKRISTAGWIVFAALLLMIFPLFWIGFLIKEEVTICPVCNTKIS
jgi:RNA polymerase subunit RPABC4/transcription elongation factor Spt4